MAPVMVSQNTTRQQRSIIGMPVALAGEDAVDLPIPRVVAVRSQNTASQHISSAPAARCRRPSRPPAVPPSSPRPACAVFRRSQGVRQAGSVQKLPPRYPSMARSRSSSPSSSLSATQRAFSRSVKRLFQQRLAARAMAVFHRLGIADAGEMTFLPRDDSRRQCLHQLIQPFRLRAAAPTTGTPRFSKAGRNRCGYAFSSLRPSG